MPARCDAQCGHACGHISDGLRRSRRRLGAAGVVGVALCAAVVLTGCQTESGGDTPAAGGYPGFGFGGAGVAGFVVNGASGAGGAPQMMPGAAGQPVASAGGAAVVPGGSGGTPSSGGAVAVGGVAGASGGMTGAGGGIHVHDHCEDGELPDPSDSMLTGMPDEWKATPGDIDLVEPKPVLAWMGARQWEISHDAWHNVRRCKGGGAPPTSSAICAHKELIAAHQECSDAEDGYEFLVTHRHMLMQLKQAFPQHADLFAGFPHFPYNATDVPMQWQGRWGTGWSAQIIQTAQTLEDIEHQLSKFPTEGDLGKYIQCGGMSNGASSIHGALHFKWVVNSSPYSLGKQPVNIDNYMFWKLHGWIDEIWERYRVAKGIAPDEQKLKDSLMEQCREMQALGAAVDPSARNAILAMPLPVEHGVFHEKVRPIFEKVCSGCHSESSPEANMALGGHISSADVVKGLVNVISHHGGPYVRIQPGDASQSWLYLKVAGMAAMSACQDSGCNDQVMPPTGQVTLSATDLATIKQWITDGAQPPTQ